MFIRLLLILVVLATALGLFAWFQIPHGIPVDVVVVERGEIAAFIEERAATRLPDVFRITMPMQGRVLPIQLEPGDHVERGQIVANLDTADLTTDRTEAENSVQQYVKSLDQLNLAIQQAEQTVVASQRKYEFLEREFGRMQELFREKSASESERNQAELRMIESRIDLRNDELQVDILKIGRAIVDLLRDTENAQLQKIERDLQRADIKSPVAGTVLRKEVANEQVLAAGETLLEVGELPKLEVLAELLTQDAALVDVGDEVRISGPAIGSQPVLGNVSQIYPQGFTKISSLGVEQQRVNVIVQFAEDVIDKLQQDGRQLGVDYRLNVRIYTESESDVLIVPRSAVFRDIAGNWQVFVVEDDLAVKRQIELGIVNDFRVAITSGLQEGDLVVLAPEAELEEGQQLQPVLADTLAEDPVTSME